MTTFRRTIESFRDGDLTLDGRFYTDEDAFVEEREAIFAKHWQCVGREEEAEHPGQFFLARIAGESIIVLRDDGAGLRAFYNVCRHRGARLCATDNGRVIDLRCRYHGWTYNRAGELISAPLMTEVEGFDKSSYPLKPISIATYDGFIFVSIADEPEPFDRAVRQHFMRFERWGLSELRAARVIEYDVMANWKIIVENYSECYHCPTVHPEFSQKIHYRSGMNDAYEGPLLGGFMQLKEGISSLSISGARCGPVLGQLNKSDLSRVYFYALFPNMTISLHPDYVMIFTLDPISAARTQVRCQWLFAKSTIVEKSCRADEAVEFWDHTNQQDWEVCELVQQGVGSRSYGPSPMSNTESLPAAFIREVMKALKA